MKCPDRRQAILLAITAALGAGFAMFGYLPIARQKSVLKESMRRHSVTLEQIQMLAGQLADMEKKAADMEQKTAGFDKKVPAQRQFAQLWQEIARLMNEHNLSDQLVQPGAEIRGEPVSRMELSLQCSGRFEDVFGLFRSLERMDRLICIERVELKNDDAFGGHVAVRACASVYFQTDGSRNG